MRERPLVLLVDDEEVFLEIASMSLQAGGFETATVCGSEHALQKVEELLPDMVLSDIYMAPGPSGWDLALDLRHDPRTRDIKFAFFTSLRDPWLEFESDKKRMVAELGSVTFFSKIDDVGDLAKDVSRLLEVR